MGSDLFTLLWGAISSCFADGLVWGVFSHVCVCVCVCVRVYVCVCETLYVCAPMDLLKHVARASLCTVSETLCVYMCVCV